MPLQLKPSFAYRFGKKYVTRVLSIIKSVFSCWSILYSISGSLFISNDELNSFYIKVIGKKTKENISRYLTIKYEIIENDKKDVTKKLSNCKFCSGAILTSFLADEKEIFKFYTDFNLYDKTEIEKRIDCTIKVYKNHVKKL